MHTGLFRYIVGGRRVTLSPAHSIVAARYVESVPREDRAGIAQQEAGIGPILARFEVPAEKFTIYPITPPPGEDGVSAATVITRLDSSPSVVRAAQVFQLGDKRVLATDRILVRFKKGQAYRVQTLQTMGFEYLTEIDGTFVFRLPDTEDPLDVAARLVALDWIQYAEPDLVTIGDRPRIVRDEAMQALAAGGQQYAITITQTDLAWKLRSGTPSVKIAILDDGIDTSHPSLSGAIVGAYDAVLNRSGALPYPWDTHGTAAAGIAAASDVGGLRGVASGCSLLAVRIALSPARGARWATANSYISAGIDWAVRQGADVLSCSWGGGAPSNAVIESIGRARQNGRGGKGCVVVVAAGNDSGSVEFPANVEGVLAVAGTNEFDEFKSPYTRDGENWWGSNFGPEIDVAAPAVHIYTTDVVGPGGNAAGDFVANFNGTSAATPLVAGAAALILSVQGSLSEAAVRQALRESADKVGQYPYAGQRNNYLGYGRLNVERAVKLVAASQLPAPAPQPPTSAPTPSANRLRGTLRQATANGRRLAAYYLDQDGQAAYLLKSYSQDAAGRADALEAQSLAFLSRLVDRSVEVQYSARQITPNGAILWGADVQVAGSAAGRTQVAGDEPPPNEVRMGYVEEQPESGRGGPGPCVPPPDGVCLG